MNVLELRVIDLGPNRVVQIVKGDKFFAERFPFTDADVCIYDRDIDYIKQGLAQYLDKLNAEGEYRVEFANTKGLWMVAARGGWNVGTRNYSSEAEAQAECDRLNGKPPVPRAEVLTKVGGMGVWFYNMHGNLRYIHCETELFKALEQIVGHSIPVYEPKPRYKGTWKRVAPRIITIGDVYTSDQALTILNAKIEHSMSGIEIYSYTVTEEV